MIKINILSGSKSDLFRAHWDKERFPETQYYIRENSEEQIDWDVVVVYENIRELRAVRCRKGQLVYFAGEPPMMRPLLDSFLSQFDEVVIPNKNSSHPHKLLSHGFLNWSMGVSFKTRDNRYSFEQLKNLATPKTRNISIVTSTKKMMPGHNRRMRIVERLQKDFPEAIDYYGVGHRFVDYKADALIPYRFHICMENSTIPYYWTEKFADPLLANSVPIYLGCTNIADYFDPRGFVSFSCDDYEKLHSVISDILSNPEREYEKFYPYMRKNRQLLMDKENIIPFVIERYGKGGEAVVERTIKPMDEYPLFKWYILLIRAKRLAYKMFSKLKK